MIICLIIVTTIIFLSTGMIHYSDYDNITANANSINANTTNANTTNVVNTNAFTTKE